MPHETTEPTLPTKGSGRRQSRRDFLKVTAGGLAALSVPSILSACGTPQTTTTSPTTVPPAGATVAPNVAPTVVTAKPKLVGALNAEPPSLDAIAIEQRNAHLVIDNIYEPLVDRDAAGKIIPHLADSWEWTSDTNLRMKLHPNVKFHDGKPFNADAVVYSVERVLDPNTKSQNLGSLGSLSGAAKVDDLTVDLQTSQPDAVVLSGLTMLYIMEREWTEAAGTKVSSTANGTGPYKLVNWDRNVALDLEANNNYWRGTPRISASQWRIIGEDSTRYQAVITGEVDLFLNPLPDQLPTLPNYKSVLNPSYSFIRYSTFPTSKVLDPKIRLAMNYAVDKELLKAQLYAGLGEVLPGELSGPEMFGFNPNLQAFPFDLAKAKSVLAESSYDGSEIDYVGVKGQYAGDAMETQAVIAMLQEAGLKFNLQVVDPSSWQRIIDRGQTPVPPSCSYMRHDNTLFDAARTVSNYYDSKNNWGTYDHLKATIRPMIEQAQGELDDQKRKEIYWQIFQIGHDDPVGLFLFHHVDLWAMTKRLNFTPRVDGKALLYEMSLS